MASLKYDPDTRTTTLVFGPFPKPLTFEDVHLIAAVQARAIGYGYTVLRGETEKQVILSAVITAPRNTVHSR